MRIHHACSTFLKQRTHMFALHNSRIVSGRQSAAPEAARWCDAKSAFTWPSHQDAKSLLLVWKRSALHQTYSISLLIGISRCVCVGCEREGKFRRLFPTRRAACIHVGKSPSCSKLGLGVRAWCEAQWGRAGAAGPAPDVRHQPPAISKPKLGYPKLSQKK